MRNPKYEPNKKNGGLVPPVPDPRLMYIPIECKECMECRKRKAREWQIRLQEEIKTHKNGKFIALTFSNQSIQKLVNNPDKLEACKHLKKLRGYDLDNAIATTAVRLFLERWRKKFKKSLRHWLVTELGHNGTENIHIHGIVWTDEPFQTIREIWNYGFIYPRSKEEEKRNYVGPRSINYIIKYVNKQDKQHPLYKSIILTTPGIGANYVNRADARKNKFTGVDTDETYRTSSGHKIALPIYWRNKIYTEQEREQLWLIKLDKNERWIMGEKIKIKKGSSEYANTLKYYQNKNKELGYGNGRKTWEQQKYEEDHRAMMQAKRMNNEKEE